MRRSLGWISLVLVAAAVVCGALAAPASAPTAAQFMDQSLFKPHNSPITGAMVVNNAAWYGIDVLPQLVILTAETALGDPKLGGELARQNNFGCLRYRSAPTKWGVLANGKVSVAGGDWYTFPSAQVGMVAFGRFIKVGQGGVLMTALTSQPYDWTAFARAYYGDFSGLAAYTSKLKTLETQLRAKAAKSGVKL